MTETETSNGSAISVAGPAPYLFCATRSLLQLPSPPITQDEAGGIYHTCMRILLLRQVVCKRDAWYLLKRHRLIPAPYWPSPWVLLNTNARARLLQFCSSPLHASHKLPVPLPVQACAVTNHTSLVSFVPCLMRERENYAEKGEIPSCRC